MKLPAPFSVSVFIILFLSSLFPVAGQTIDQDADTLTTNFATPDLVTFCVGDLKKSISWYKEILNCEVEEKLVQSEEKTKLARLVTGDFHIELVQKENSIVIDDTELRDNEAYICGFKNFGFRVDNFDEYYEFVSSKKPPYLSDITDNAFTTSRFFVVQDRDKNELVFIEDLRQTDNSDQTASSTFNIVPYWASIVVEDLESEVDWFEENLGFYFYKKLDYEDIESRLLLTNGFMLELKHYRDKTISRNSISMEIKNSPILGINKITFEVDNLSMVKKHMSKNKVNMQEEISESNYAWASKHFVVFDSEENLIEIVE